MASGSGLHIPVLKGHANYMCWKMQIKMYLIHQDLFECVTGECEDTKKQQKALATDHTKMRKDTKRREKTQKDGQRREKKQKDTQRDIIQCEKTRISLDLGVFSCLFVCEVQYSLLILVVNTYRFQSHFWFTFPSN